MSDDGYKPLVDATQARRIKLQPADAVGAVRSDPSACVIAQAIRRTPGVIDVRVGAWVTRVEYRDKVVRYVLSANDRALIAGFDGGLDAFATGYTVTLDPPPVKGRLSRGDTVRRGAGTGSNRRSGTHDGVVRRRRDGTRRIDVVPDHGTHDQEIKT